MRFRLTADAVAVALLAGAAGVLLATPYDGGACRNVAAAFALPAADIPKSEPPAAPAALATARSEVGEAQQAEAALDAQRAAVAQAREKAEVAREAAREAQAKTYSMPYTSSFGTTSSAELEVDFAKSRVESAEDWLEMVKDGTVDTYGYGSVYDQSDVQSAEEDLAAARAELTTAEKALEKARSEDSANEAAVAKVERTAEQLSAAADAAEQAAEQAASTLAARESNTADALRAAQSRVEDLEATQDVAHARWFHEQRVERDEVVALNNVRASCRENGSWRAGVAAVDALMLTALVLRPALRLLPRVSLRRWRR